ncbi:MAG: hypothetical protein E7397_04645 [Ruminococcaceae bacterium]|nr:hypothetical protein [Oscillospiraceae bacterium]
MKKFLYAFICVFLLLTAQVCAEEIKIEGEDYAEANFTPTIKEGYKEFSNSAFVHSFNAMEKGQTYRISFKVNAPKKGGYNLKATTTLIAKGWTCDYWVVVNEKEEISAAQNAKILKNIASTDFRDLFGHYDLGLVHLEEGENIITFENRGDDLRSDGINVVWIDYFTLEEVPFGIYNLTPYQDLGVYERKDKVEFSIDLVSECENNMSLPFEVKDFWRQTVLKGNISAKKGAQKVYLNLGQLPVGHYTLDVRCDKQKMTGKFAVTYNKEEYTKEDSPFAMDFAAAATIKNVRDIPKYARAANLAGINWVRERFDYPSFNPAEGQYSTDVNVDKSTVGILREHGIDVTVGFTSSPVWSVKRGTYPADFMNTYWSFYHAAKTYGDAIDMWECWNEENTAFASEPADEYAAFMKVMAIAVADSGANTNACFGGFAGAGDTAAFINLCMQNGILDYSAMYNNHAYNGKGVLDIIPQAGLSNLDFHTNLIYTADENNADIPLWITEGGMARTIPSGAKNMTWQGEKEASQGVVIGMTQSIARGTAKHFWFILGPYAETINDFGCFNVNNEPMAHYSAYANLLYQLQIGEYKGKMTGLPAGAEGHLFFNGDHDVAVVWSENATEFIPKSNGNLKVCDIMGAESYALAGAPIRLSNYPVYVHFNGEADLENYLPARGRNIRKIQPQTFTEAQKVVLCQRFYGDNYNTPRTDGYEITGYGVDNIFDLEVYNLNDREVTVTVTGKPETDGFILTEPTQTITVAPKTRGILKFNIKTTDTVTYDVTQFLRFDGVLEGEALSPSISRIIPKVPLTVEPQGIFENSRDVKNWTLNNASRDSVITGTQVDEGAVQLEIKFGGGDMWAYPLFHVKDSSVLAGTTGICFDIASDREVTAFGMNVFLDYSDGRRYFLGNDKMMDVRNKQYVIPWTKFIMFHSPFGVKVDTRDFDPTLIEKIEIGGNRRGSGNGNPLFTVSNFGYYTADFDLSTAAAMKVEISGIENEKTYQQGELTTATATWSEDLAYDRIGVKIGAEDYEKFTIEGNQMTIDLSGLERGAYRMRVYAESAMNYVYGDTVWFNVE